MLEVTMDSIRNQTMFDCPACTARDIIHISQQRECYGCGIEHDFNIPVMLKSAAAKVDYHFMRTGKCSK